MKKKKIPMRMCVGCREMKPKKELIRIVKSSEGSIKVDFVGKSPGRGAYICESIPCLEKARKGKILEKTFEQKIDDCIYYELQEELKKRESK